MQQTCESTFELLQNHFSRFLCVQLGVSESVHFPPHMYDSSTKLQSKKKKKIIGEAVKYCQEEAMMASE